MKSLSHQFLDFARSKPADEEYDPSHARLCALGQFGLQLRYRDCEPNSPLERIYEAAVFADTRFPDNPEFTFGALADRLEAALESVSACR